MATANSQQRKFTQLDERKSALIARTMAPTATSTDEDEPSIPDEVTHGTPSAPSMAHAMLRRRRAAPSPRRSAPRDRYCPAYERREFRNGSSRYKKKEHGRKNTNIRDMTRYISVVGKPPQGGKITRRYEQLVNFSNLAAATSSGGYSLGVRTTGAAYAGLALNLYAGRAIFGTGTLIATLANFGEEAFHYCDTFKWMTINAFQVEFMPIVNNVVIDSWEVTDQSVQADPGIVRYTKWNGDDSVVNSGTGVVLYDTLNFQRFPHKVFKPVGKKIGMLAVKLNEIDQQNQQFGTDYIVYDRAKSIDCTVIGSAAVEYPHYGVMLQWEHANLSANADKYRFMLRFMVEVQWNTVKDDSIQNEAKQFAYNQSRDLSDMAIPTVGPDIPVSYYPKVSIDPVLEVKYQQELAKRQASKPKLPLPKEDYVEVSPPAKPKVMSRPPSPARH